MERGGLTYHFGMAGSAPRFARYENVALKDDPPPVEYP